MKCRQMLLLLTVVLHQSDGANYSHLLALHNANLNNGTYSRDIRPLLNQQHVLPVQINFSLLSVVEINDVFQRFTCNGFLNMQWTDEILAWRPEDYGNLSSITPDTEDIWKPRLILTNTLVDRDPFKDDYAPLLVLSDGTVTWKPGGLITTSCDLDMTNYPFDKQVCYVEFIAMFYTTDQVMFYSEENISSSSGSSPSHGEWEVTGIDSSIHGNSPQASESGPPRARFSFSLKRKPLTFLFTVLLPVVFLSLLNILVFAIPADSGEKVGYGITVLLSQAVFMTLLQTMMPTSSKSVPNLTVYVFGLLSISVFTVVSSIFVLHYYHKQQEVQHELKSELSGGDGRSVLFVTGSDTFQVYENLQPGSGSPESRHLCHKNGCREMSARTNHCKALSQKINILSFALTLLAWLVITVLYLAYVMSS